MRIGGFKGVLLPALMIVPIMASVFILLISTTSVSATTSSTLDKTLVKANTPVRLTVTVTNSGASPIDNVRIIFDNGSNFAPLSTLPKDNIVKFAVDNVVVLPAGTVVELLAKENILLPEGTDVTVDNNKYIWVENHGSDQLQENTVMAVRQDTSAENISIGDNIAVTQGVSVNLNIDNRLRLLKDTSVTVVSGNIVKLPENTVFGVVAQNDNSQISSGENVTVAQDVTVTLKDNRVSLVTNLPANFNGWNLTTGMYIQLIDNQVILTTGTTVMLGNTALVRIAENENVLRVKDKLLDATGATVETNPENWTQTSGITDPLSTVPAVEWKGSGDNIPVGGSRSFPFTLTTPNTTEDRTTLRFWVRTPTGIEGPITLLKVDGMAPTATVSASPSLVKDDAVVTITVTASEPLAELDNVMVAENNAPENTQVPMSSTDMVTWTGTYTTGDNVERDGLATIFVIGSQFEDLVGNKGDGVTENTFTVKRALTPHAPISINGNAGFTSPDPVNGGGSGTENDPYIIENWDISANSANGIYIGNTTAYFIIRNCQVENGSNGGYSGIVLDNVVNGKIENCTTNNNYYYGIYLYYSANNTISGNTAGNNSGGGYYGVGIQSSFAENNRIEKNIVENNIDSGICLYYSDNSIIENNLVQSNFRDGIYILYSDNNLISNNTEDNSQVGIDLGASDINIVSNNTLKNNTGGGILLVGISDNNIVYRNTVENSFGSIGIFNSGNNLIWSNTVENNFCGIGLDLADNNFISGNIVKNSDYSGVKINGSNNNLVYHNSIINNATQASDDGANFWDNGYPSGGNYWSEYTGVDENRGENQNMPGSDGIGDTPYAIAGGSNLDHYPLMNPVVNGLVSRPTIYINGNDNFIPANGVTSGSGTENDPYIIENWGISAENAIGIWIENTTAHFVIRNCYIHDGKDNEKQGIYFSNVKNGKIDNNLLENNLSGIYLDYYSDNNIVSNNVVKNGYNPSIELEYSDNNLLFNNTVENNHGDGIRLHYSDNNFLSNNTLKNNFYDGIDISGSNNIASNNIMENGTNGIRLDGSSNLLSNNVCFNNNNYGIRLEGLNNTLDNNVCSNNFIFGIFLESSSSNNTLTNNTCDNNGNGIYLSSSSDNNTLTNNTCENNGYDGFELYYSDNNLVSGNTVGNNNDGIHLVSSGNNVISGNIAGNNGNGIVLEYSDNNLLFNNTVENNDYYYGITLGDSDNNVISGNTVENNSYGGIVLGSSDNNLMENNIVENNNESGIYLGNSENNLIENNIVKNNDYGIRLEYSDNNLIENNLVENNSDRGIYLSSSSNTRLINNTCENNYVGIELHSSDNNLIENNLTENNDYHGITLNYSDNNLISNNVAENNLANGIRLEYSDNNLIENNLVENNSDRGIILFYSSNNSLTNNTCENNYGGIHLAYSFNNRIYHNNILNNSIKAYDDSSNAWDNGYPSGGNYWSDYTGSDNYHGENQNIPGSDEIGDVPYNISGGSNQDRYPLMNPWPFNMIVRAVQVVITPPSQENDNGGTLKYDVLVKNLGNVLENFQLTRGDNAGWTLSLDNSWLLIPQGENRITRLTVTIPASAIGGTFDNIWVKATSKDDSAVSDNKSCLAHVKTNENEPLWVNKHDTTTTTQLSSSEITLGENVTDTATVTRGGLDNSFPLPTGTVMFQVKFDSENWTTYDTENLVNGTATSIAYVPLQAGQYYFRAIYSGDNNYNGSQSS